VSRRRLALAAAAVLAGAAANGAVADLLARAGLSQGPSQATFHPAQYLSGTVPGISSLAVAGGQVLLEVTVTPTGTVADVKTLRSTPPFTEGLVGAVRGWRFRPAEQLRPAEGTGASARPPRWEPVRSTVLAASVIRLPATFASTTLGQAPVEVAPPSGGAPFPLNVVTPVYPPQALFGGSVLIEIAVGADGSASGAKSVGSAPNPAANPAANSATDAGNLIDTALASARGWWFQPAVVDGARVPAYAYVIFVFRQPVLAPAH